MSLDALPTRATSTLAPQPEPALPLAHTGMVVLALAFSGALALTALSALPRRASQAELAVASLDARSEVLALGASHVFTGIEPTLTARPWTLLSAGLMNYTFMESVLAAHEARLPSLRLVLLDLDPLPVFVDSYASARGDYEHLLDLRPDLGALHESLARKATLAKERLLSRQLPFRRALWRDKLDAERLQALWRPQASEHEIVPGHERFVGRRPDADVWGARARAHRAIYAPSMIERNLRAFERMVSHLRARGAQVAFVRFPVHAAYLAASPPEFRAAFQQLTQRARRVAPDATLLDYASAPFADEEFYDDDHLNQRGAVRFTPMLSAAAERLLHARP